MQLNITRLDQALPLPKYETAGACAFDVCARESTIIAPKTLAFIPTSLIVEVPEGHVLFLASRSSTPKKKGLLIPHGMGVIDQDFCGPKDELLVQVWNFTDEPVIVERGDRVAQAVVCPMLRCEIVETKELATAVSRGGFGSTG